MEINQALIDAHIPGAILKDNPNGGSGDDYQEFCEVLDGVRWKPSDDTPDDSELCHNVGIVRPRGTLLCYKVLKVSDFEDLIFEFGNFGKILSFGFAFMRSVTSTSGAYMVLKSHTDTALFQHSDGYMETFPFVAGTDLTLKQYTYYNNFCCNRIKIQVLDDLSILDVPLLMYFVIKPQKTVTYKNIDPTSTSTVTAADYKFRANAIGKIKSITFMPYTASNSWKINSFKSDSTQLLHFNTGTYAAMSKGHALYVNSDNLRPCYLSEVNVSQETVFTINTDVKSFSFVVHYE